MSGAARRECQTTQTPGCKSGKQAGNETKRNATQRNAAQRGPAASRTLIPNVESNVEGSNSVARPTATHIDVDVGVCIAPHLPPSRIAVDVSRWPRRDNCGRHLIP